MSLKLEDGPVDDDNVYRHCQHCPPACRTVSAHHDEPCLNCEAEKSAGNDGILAIETQWYSVVRIMPPDGMVIRDRHGRNWVVTAYGQKEKQ